MRRSAACGRAGTVVGLTKHGRVTNRLVRRVARPYLSMATDGLANPATLEDSL